MFGRVQRVTVVVPVAVLTAAWAVHVSGVGVRVEPQAPEPASETLPDGTEVPAAPVEARASVGDPYIRRVDTKLAEASEIPRTALAAYQRSGAVINQADPACRLPWELITAIGRVESDHGRHGGSALDAKGVARPGIFGVALDGTRTALITDTDGGQYDHDTTYDRAVGPMQFIPSTWAIVGVDGDSDGDRNPQDIDDAALATAVYLCAGEDDLSTDAGQRAAVFRYNRSQDYVDLVLDVMEAYQAGDWSAVPDPVPTLLPDPPPGNGGGGKPGGKPGKDPTSSPTPSPSTSPGPSPSPTPTPTPSPSPTATPTLPGGLPTLPPGGSPLTYAEAAQQCEAAGIPPSDEARMTACIEDLLNP